MSSSSSFCQISMYINPLIPFETFISNIMYIFLPFVLIINAILKQMEDKGQAITFCVRFCDRFSFITLVRQICVYDVNLTRNYRSSPIKAEVDTR